MSHARSNCTRVLGKQRTRHARRRSARPPARKTWPGGAAARFLAWRPGVRGVNARTSIKKMHTMQNCAQVSMQLLARRAQQAAGAPATPGAAHAARAHRPARASRPAGRRLEENVTTYMCAHVQVEHDASNALYQTLHACPQRMCIYTVRHAKSGRRVAHFMRPAHVKAPRQGDLWGGRP